MCNILLHSEPVLRHSDNRVPGHHQREVSKYYDMYVEQNSDEFSQNTLTKH